MAATGSYLPTKPSKKPPACQWGRCAGPLRGGRDAGAFARSRACQILRRLPPHAARDVAGNIGLSTSQVMGEVGVTPVSDEYGRCCQLVGREVASCPNAGTGFAFFSTSPCERKPASLTMKISPSTSPSTGYEPKYFPTASARFSRPGGVGQAGGQKAARAASGVSRFEHADDGRLTFSRRAGSVRRGLARQLLHLHLHVVAGTPGPGKIPAVQPGVRPHP